MILFETQVAGLPHVLRTIGIIVVVWYALRIIFRYVGPWLMKKGVQKMQQKAEDKMRDQFGQRHRSSQEEGKVTVEKPRDSSSRSGADDGEYVEFEEVE